MLQAPHSNEIGGYPKVPPDNLLLGIEAIKVAHKKSLEPDRWRRDHGNPVSV